MRQTSKQAIRTQSQRKLLIDRKKIISVLRRNYKNGCTRQELADKTGIAIQTVCWRISDMRATGLVNIDGKKVYKKHTSQPCEALFLVIDKLGKAA